MSETSTPHEKRPGRGLRIVLIASLAVNLLLIGVLAGGVMRFAHRPPPPGGQTDYRSLWRALPSEARADLRDAARTHGGPGDRPPRLSPEDRRARAERINAAIIAALRAEPFDAEAFETILEGDREAIARRLDVARQAFVDRVATLTAEQRRTMAAELEQVWEDRLPGR